MATAEQARKGSLLGWLIGETVRNLAQVWWSSQAF
jgi:hypothetical protein